MEQEKNFREHVQERFQDQDEIEIDLMELFLAIKRKIMIIILAMVLGGGIAGAFSKFVLVPQYQSTAMLYILSKETTLTSLADLQIGSQLTQDYKVIVVSRPVLEDVIEKLSLNLNYNELKEKLTINNPANTRILSITAQDADPQMAKILANEVANTASEYIGDLMEMVPPKMIEEGVVPIQKSSPSNSKNAMLGAMLGGFLVCGLITLKFIMNDAVTTEEDVNRYLGLSVLATVPEWKSDSMPAGTEKARKKSRRKKRR